MKTSKVGLALLLVCCAWAVLIVTGCAKDEVDTTGTIYGIVNDADNGDRYFNLGYAYASDNQPR